MKQSTTFACVANKFSKVLQGYTKGIRFVAVLTVLLTMGIGQAWAETIYTNSGATGTTNGITASGSINANNGNAKPSFGLTSSSKNTITLTGLNLTSYTNVVMTFDYQLGKSGSSYSSLTVTQYNSNSVSISTNNITGSNNTSYKEATIALQSACTKITIVCKPASSSTYNTYVDNINITGDLASLPWVLKGSFDNWGDGVEMTEVSTGKATATLDLAANTQYEFKFVNGSNWLGNNGTINADISNWVFTSSDGNVKLNSGLGGIFTFTIDYSASTTQPKVSITYPRKDIYMACGDSWCDATPTFFAHAWRNGGTETYDVKLAQAPCESSIYITENIPAYCSHVIFTRQKPGSTQLVWSGENFWNQSEDITISTNNLFTCTGWNNNKGTFSGGTYTPPTYKITFSGNGNTGGSMSNVTGIPCDGSTTLVTNGYTRTGYTFNNWKTNVAVTANSSSVAANGSVANKATISNITSNITLTAQWKANTYTITLNGNNGSGHTTSVTATYNSATLSSAITNPTRTGYTFKGWYSSASGGSMVIGTNGKLQANVSGYTGANGIWTVTSGKTLYAQWTPITYQVKFNGNGSTSGSMSNQTFTYGTAQSLTANAFTRTDYKFAGWNTNADGSGTSYADKESVNNLANTDGTIVNLYAKWTKIHTITWMVNGEQYGKTQEVEDGQTIGSLPDAPDAPASCSDKVFMGWTESATVNNDGTSITYISTSIQPDGDKIYHAVFATKTTKESTTTIEKTKTETFENQSASTTYNSTKNYTAANSNAGIAWTIYYGTVSESDVITGSKSAQMRWYDSAPTNLPYIESQTKVSKLKSISYNVITSDTDYKYSVSYSTNGTSWTAIATNQSASTTKQTKTHTINANGVDAYIKIAITSSSNVSDKAKFRVDDVTFTYLESTTTTTTTYTDYVTSCTPQYTITLNLDGGVFDETPDGWTKVDENTYTQVVNENTVVTLPTPTKKGYTYKGWRKNSLDNPVTSITAIETATYTAVYDCALNRVGISGPFALVSGQQFQLTATAYDENGAEIDCPDNTGYAWQRRNPTTGNWEDVTDNDGVGKMLTYPSCEVAHCGLYRCHVTYGNCGAWSHVTAQDNGYNVRVLHLKGSFEGDWTKAYAFTATDQPGIATLKLDLTAGNTYNFKIYDGISEYGNDGIIEGTTSDWWGYGSDNNKNTTLKTGADGSYEFTLDFTSLLNSGYVLRLKVSYPPTDQASGKTIYYDNLVHNWQNVYYRIGHNRDNGDGTWGWNQNQKMTLVPGTSHLYKTTTPTFDNFEAWHIANNVSWADKNSIYLVNPDGTEYDITHATEYQKYAVVEDITLTPDANGTKNNVENCTYYPVTKQSGMKTWKATVIAAVGGTITVKYTHHDGTEVNDFTSGDIDLAHTCLLTITATPDAGYTLTSLTVNDEPFTSGNIHTLTEDAVIKATWTEKATPTFAWSAATCTAALEADNTFPTLNNPNTLPVTYTSSNTDVATIDANGNITLVATGTTTITADGAETATHKSATTTYELTIVASNCRWVETDIANINSDDEVIVAMVTPLGVYALDHSKGTSTYPPAYPITVEGNVITSTPIDAKAIWNISGNATDGYILYPNGSTTTWLYCTASDYNVKVGKNADNLFTIDDGYLRNKTHKVYVGVYNSSDWRHYPANTGNAIAGQTLKFYKRECLDSEHYWVTWDAGEGTWEDKSSKKLESYQVGETITAPTENPTCEGYRFDGWSPEPTTMPAQNTTFTAKWTKVYTITWYENGVPSYTYVPSDNPVVTWEDDIADCGTKKFYGWTADDTFVSDPTTPPTLISKGTTIAGDVTYYAVYADAEEPANPGYTKVTTISEGTYLIATGETENNKAYTGKYPDKTYGGTCDVTVNNQVISTKPTSAVEVEVTLGTGANSGKFAIYDGTYYLSAPTSNDLTFNNSVVYDWKLTSEGYINSTSQTSRYIQLNSSANPIRFACYTGTQKYAYLYKKQTTTYANFAVSCATYAITITPPTGGTVTTTPADEAGAGQTITVNVTPDDCKYLTALKYNDGSDHNINIASTPYTFTMPAADVTVTATFADKNATDIEILTSAHRMLMQGSAFVGEQVRITYNNGDKETLNWNDSRLTFTGHNTATLGSQTVTVTYNDCGTQSASYNIEVIDGLGITFWDGDYTETIKYEPGDLVDVDNKIGQNICSGWEFAGWSETKVANESNGFTPVHNFNATDAKVLYAVYAEIRMVKEGDVLKEQYKSADMVTDLQEGARYIVAAYVNSNNSSYGYTALTPNSKDTYYMAGTHTDNNGFAYTQEKNDDNSNIYCTTYEIDSNNLWRIESDGDGYWQLFNIATKKYLDLSAHENQYLTTNNYPNGKIVIYDYISSIGDNDSRLELRHSTEESDGNKLYWDRTAEYFRQTVSTSDLSCIYCLTKDKSFTSTPPCSPLSATFHGNGGIVTDGVNTGDDLTITEPTRDAGITTPIASFADCNGKSWTFVGWSREEIDVTRVPVLTTDLLHDGGGNKHYDIQEVGEEFWAVFTNTGDPETKYGTITFTDADVTRQYENAKTITKSVTAMGDYDFELYHVSNASSKGIQFDENNATRGYIKNITSLGKINSISFNDFQVGYINYVKVYVGNMPNAINTLLTEADLQQTGNTYTYYPSNNYAYVKIEATDYCGITSISIDFGKGTQIWATTPDCSTITLSGDELYVTSTNGQSIRAAERLTVKAVQLESKAKVVISSNSSDIYFSDVQDANFTQAVKPTETLTLTTDVDGNLSATEIYVHYRPSVDGTGIPEDVVVSANLETPNPSISDDKTIHVRNLPADFVIAAKWGDNWYAMSADMNSQSSTNGWLIKVDDAANPTKAFAAPNTTKYGLKSVYTSNSTDDRFENYGERLVFVENVEESTPVANKTLYNGGGSGTSNTNIQVYAQYSGYYSTNPDRYEWIPTTTNMQDYTLTSAHRFTKDDATLENARTVSLDNHGVFGTLLQDKAYNGMVRLLPVDNFYAPAELQVVEWKQNSVSIMYTGAGTKYTTQVGNNAESGVQALSAIDQAVYSLSTADLTTATNQPLIIYIKDDANATIGSIKLTIPAIVATNKTSTALGVTEENAKATSIVVLDGATLTADATKYTFDDITVYPGGNLIIDNGNALGMYTLTLRAGSSWGAAEYENKYPQFLLRGDYSNTSGQINLDYVTTQDYYYPLSVPEQVTIADIKYPVDIYGNNVKANNTGSFQLKYYDGAQRVAHGSQYGTGWRVVDENTTTTLTPNQGYAIWGIPKKINGTRQTYGIHRIPIKKAANDLVSNEMKPEEIQVYAYGDASTPPNDRGWNYLGNPYLAGLGGMNGSYSDLQMGLLVQEIVDGKWTGGWVNNGDQVRYITLTNDCQNFEALPVADATIPAFTTFFIQAAQDGAIALSAPATIIPSSVAARHYAAQQDATQEITTGIILTGNDQTDRTGLLIADHFTEKYDYNADLSKFENSGINLYTIGKDGKLAFMAINQALAEQPIPLGYGAPADGEYTIAFDEERYNATDISALYLIDYDSHEKTNLLHTDYSFVTAAGTNNQRFALQVAFAPANATNIEWIDDATVQVGVEGNTLLLYNLPTDAAVQVFDALGRLMYHAPTVPTDMQLTLPTGYYLVRIANKQHTLVIDTLIP